MNPRQLEKLGVPPACVNAALQAIHTAAEAGLLRTMDIKKTIRAVAEAPGDHLDDALFGRLAQELIDYGDPWTPTAAIDFRTWGAAGIDQGSFDQMKAACSLPNVVAGALMPDAHIGYGLPIGGVLALDNAVVPYAVGVDIACRMKLSVFDLPASRLDEEKQAERFDTALEKGTRFGVGGEFAKPLKHAVMDLDWTVSRVVRENKDKAWRQLGTSGSGNHFAEFGVLTLDTGDEQLRLAPGRYVALLTHSGSRGTGAAVCSVFSNIARAKLPRKYEAVGRLAWLDLDTEEGREYWDSMNLMGEYAAANHDCIHRNVAALVGAEIVAGVENHHNFAWKETHAGRELIVHRKGATPAGKGVLGVIPGSMADPAFVVRGKGNAASIDSASHGAGRRMSRTAAKSKYTWRAVQKDLANRGVRVLSAGADEVPGVYKNILDVMREQQDLVDVVARFDPRVVKMCGDGSKAED
ncbi:MAG: RtcB family protein [Planctomycetia bacterium]|nr:RtcB family protein [Planctomycetia bacterium]